MRVIQITYSSEESLLRLCADDGSEGWAPGVVAPMAQSIIETYGPVVEGCSVWERDRAWRACRDAGRAAGLTPASWGYVDIALWDLFAKAQGLPVFRAIGGFRDRVPVYRSGSDTAECDVVVGEALAAHREGSFGYCLQAVCADETVGMLRALRREAGPELRILCDGRQRFDLEEALQIGRALEEIDGHWFAEPLRDRDVTGLQRLSDALSVPVVAGAFMGDSILAGTRALTTRAVDRVRMVLPDGGGITEALKLARGAEALQMNCEIKGRGACGLQAAAHVMGAVRNAELLAVDVALKGKALPALEQGHMQLSMDPGLGLDRAEGSRS